MFLPIPLVGLHQNGTRLRRSSEKTNRYRKRKMYAAAHDRLCLSKNKIHCSESLQSAIVGFCRGEVR